MIDFEVYKLTKLAVIGGTLLALLLAVYRPANERLQRTLTGIFGVLALVATLASKTKSFQNPLDSPQF